MAHNYDKILAPFKRTDSKSKYVTVGTWSKPEFSFLQDTHFVWTLKIDGACIVISWDGERVSVKGHTEKTQFSDQTITYLKDIFCTAEAETIFEDMFGEQPVDICGEFVSKEMNQNYGHPDGYFYAFDIRNGTTKKYWDRETLETFVKRFPQIGIVPVMLIGTIEDAVEWVKDAKNNWNKDFSKISLKGAINPLGKYLIEGLVGRPGVELYNSKGERVITKVKCCDYE